MWRFNRAARKDAPPAVPPQRPPHLRTNSSGNGSGSGSDEDDGFVLLSPPNDVAAAAAVSSSSSAAVTAPSSSPLSAGGSGAGRWIDDGGALALQRALAQQQQPQHHQPQPPPFRAQLHAPLNILGNMESSRFAPLTMMVRPTLALPSSAPAPASASSPSPSASTPLSPSLFAIMTDHYDASGSSSASASATTPSMPFMRRSEPPPPPMPHHLLMRTSSSSSSGTAAPSASPPSSGGGSSGSGGGGGPLAVPPLLRGATDFVLFEREHARQQQLQQQQQQPPPPPPQQQSQERRPPAPFLKYSRGVAPFRPGSVARATAPPRPPLVRADSLKAEMRPYDEEAERIERQTGAALRMGGKTGRMGNLGGGGYSGGSLAASHSRKEQKRERVAHAQEQQQLSQRLQANAPLYLDTGVQKQPLLPMRTQHPLQPQQQQEQRLISNTLVDPSFAESRRPITLADVAAHLTTVSGPATNERERKAVQDDTRDGSQLPRAPVAVNMAELPLLQHAFYAHHRAILERLFHSASARTRLLSVEPLPPSHHRFTQALPVQEQSQTHRWLQHVLDCLAQRGGAGSGVAQTKLLLRFYHAPSCCRATGPANRHPAPPHSAAECARQCQPEQIGGTLVQAHPNSGSASVPSGLHTAATVPAMLARFAPQVYTREVSNNNNGCGGGEQLVQERAHLVLACAQLDGWHSATPSEAERQWWGQVAQPLLLLRVQCLEEEDIHATSEQNSALAATKSKMSKKRQQQQQQSHLSAKRIAQLRRAHMHRTAEQAVARARDEMDAYRNAAVYEEDSASVPAAHSQSAAAAERQQQREAKVASAAEFDAWMRAQDDATAAALADLRLMDEEEARQYAAYDALADRHAHELQQRLAEADAADVSEHHHHRFDRTFAQRLAAEEDVEEQEVEEEDEEDEQEDEMNENAHWDDEHDHAYSRVLDDYDRSAGGGFLSHSALGRPPASLLSTRDVQSLSGGGDGGGGRRHHPPTKMFPRVLAKNFLCMNMQAKKQSKLHYRHAAKPKDNAQMEVLHSRVLRTSAYNERDDAHEQEEE